MNVTFSCPQCSQQVEVDFDADTPVIACPHCESQWAVPNELTRCLVCPSTELYLRKDFSQGLGVLIVVVGFLISTVFWYYRMPLWTYGVLFATALIDVVLYLTVGDVLQCYRCQAQYRGVAEQGIHQPFDLETHEKHRQQRIRLEQQIKA
jgi:DNA-directed RNA polymerase subunit RPC12/RpoP